MAGQDSWPYSRSPWGNLARGGNGSPKCQPGSAGWVLAAPIAGRTARRAQPQPPVPIVDAPGETWRAVDKALRHGNRGLPGGSSLFKVLVQGGRMRRLILRPTLTIDQIL